MKNITGLVRVVLVAALACMPVATQAAGDGKASAGQDSQAGKQAQAGNKKTSGVIPVYVPPRRGAPLARVGGGTRGLGDNMPFVSVITPEHTGYTSGPQPVLYWYVSENVKTHFEFALINDDDYEPIIEVNSDQDMKAGLNSLDLSKHGVSLVPGVAYQWSVALVLQSDKRSSDIVSAGRVELVELTVAQKSQLENVTEEEAVWIYAREGYWYDAFSRLTNLIAKNPGNSELAEKRALLLEQVGLAEVAAIDR